MTVYNDFTPAKIGFFFGLSGVQLATIVVVSLPIFYSIQEQAWWAVLQMLALWIAITILVAVPVRGRSATGWLTATIAYGVGGAMSRTRFRSRVATGQDTELDRPDLPGVLASIEIHEGPPIGPSQERIAIVQNHATKTWSVTAAVVHPGIGMEDEAARERLGQGMSNLLDQCSRAELVDELLLITRTVPDDGAERADWMNKHRSPKGIELVRGVNNDIHSALSRASVRTEAFVTMVVTEAKIARHAKEAGGGREGRARVLHLLRAELEAQLRGAAGMTAVSWLTSPELSAACRTGFAPGDRAAIVEALSAQEQHSRVNADVPWAMAGPSGADTAVRHYSHDAWNSVSATIKLPVKGAVMGALAPIQTPTEAGERRSLVISYPVISRTAAERKTNSSEHAADVGEALREKAQKRQRTKERDQADRVRALDRKLARGNSMTQPYAVATVTVPKTMRAHEFGSRLDAAIRQAGFASLRLDVAQDVAFASSCVPLGISLARGTSR